MIGTTKELSKRILKCGVPADSADMTIHDLVTGTTVLHTDNYNDFRNSPFPECFFPAWSLGNLISLLPHELDNFKCDYQYDFFSNDNPIIVEGCYTLSGSLVICHNEKNWIVDYDIEGFLGLLPQSNNLFEAIIMTMELLYENGYKFDNKK